MEKEKIDIISDKMENVTIPGRNYSPPPNIIGYPPMLLYEMYYKSTVSM